MGQQGWLFVPGLKTSWPVLGLTVVCFTFVDVVTDPVGLPGEGWILKNIYGQP